MINTKNLEPIKCPHCGSDDVEYKEEAFIYRTVYGKDADGTLYIDGNWKTSDGDKSRFSCNSCLEDFELPKGVEIEWV